MTEKQEHPHAEFLRALADGEPMDAFEALSEGWSSDEWAPAHSWIALILPNPDVWRVRRKQKTIRIGDMDVPEPMRVAPEVGAVYWVASPTKADASDQIWANDSFDIRWLKQGVCHAAEQAAEAHRRALILVSGGTP